MAEQNGVKRPRIIAVGSGKGGVGKSLLSANIGIYLATLGKKVVLCDAAFGSANLHTFVGASGPDRTLADMLGHRSGSLDQVVAATTIPNLSLISGCHDPAWVANPRTNQLARMREQIVKLDADYVVIDLPSGTGAAALDLFLLADSAIVLLTPEPPSIELGYRFLRALFMRRLRALNVQSELRLGDAELRDFKGGIPSPLDIYHRALELGHERVAETCREQMLRLRPQLVFNHARSKADMDLGLAMANACRRVLGLPARFLGPIEYDDAVWVALRRGRPLLVEHPESRVAKCIEKVSRCVLARESDPIATEIPIGESHYDLLGVEPTASDEEVRRANRRMKQHYGRDSALVRGLYTRDRADEMMRRLDEAYETLVDATRRKEYDQALFPEGIPARDQLRAHVVVEESTGPRPPAERPPMPEIEPATTFTGELMQKVREARGLDLREISERTKIGMGYLDAIENEEFRKLPALVYVRGFLVEYARMLDLDVSQVVDTYLPRFKEVRGQEAPA